MFHALFFISIILGHSFLLHSAEDQTVPEVIEAIESDAQEIVEVVNEAFNRDFFRFRNPSRVFYEEVHGYFLDGTHTWYVIKMPKNGSLEIACAVLYSTEEAPETSQEGSIHMLAARSSYWGKKLSTLLLKKIEERAIQEKKSTLGLVVANTNKGLIKFYEEQGYHLTGKKFELSLAAVQPQFRETNPDGSLTIFCVHMEKNLINLK